MTDELQDASLKAVVRDIKEKIGTLFDASVVAHDMNHIERVFKIADAICISLGANRLTVAAASYLHDYHRFIEKEVGHYVRPEEAEPHIRSLLEGCKSVPLDLYDPICEAINFTEYYRCAGDDLIEKAPKIESCIVRDADILDAIGAVGIARAFMFGGRLGEPMWIPGSEFTEDVSEFVHGKTQSVIHHFHEKLLKLEFEMLTEQGRALAVERTAYMKEFIAKLLMEIA